jgi:ABC-type nitrate/sulfonate/bicarbonate transport system substrate-binding protein
VKYVVIIICCLIIASCGSKQPDTLVIGLIKPSLNHLPLQYVLQHIPGDHTNWQIEYFHSGWETNEALVAGRIDLAIMPFTYAWMDVSQAKKVKIISFLERESDGIIANNSLNSSKDLEGARLGVLKSSTLEIIPEMLFKLQKSAIPDMIPFRTPMDMAAALQAGEVDAVSYYVPSIFNLPDRFQIIDWYSHTFPRHPCCDLVASQTALNEKIALVEDFARTLQKALNMMQNNYPKTLQLAQEYYNLSPNIADQSLSHTKYIMGLEDSGRDFEILAAELMFTKGYLARRVKEDEIYHQILP